MLKEGRLKQLIERDGPYIITILLCLSAIIYLNNHVDDAVLECDLRWTEYLYGDEGQYGDLHTSFNLSVIENNNEVNNGNQD